MKKKWRQAIKQQQQQQRNNIKVIKMKWRESQQHNATYKHNIYIYDQNEINKCNSK